MEPTTEEVARIVQMAIQVGEAKGAWPELYTMAADPNQYLYNLTSVIVYLSPWEDFLRLDQDPSPVLRKAVAESHYRDHKGGDSNLGLPVHQFGYPAVYAEWKKRCGQMKEIIGRLAGDPDPEVSSAAKGSCWAAPF